MTSIKKTVRWAKQEVTAPRDAGQRMAAWAPTGVAILGLLVSSITQHRQIVSAESIAQKQIEAASSKDRTEQSQQQYKLAIELMPRLLSDDRRERQVAETILQGCADPQFYAHMKAALLTDKGRPQAKLHATGINVHGPH